MYPKKLGILTFAPSQMDLIMKFGALPMYELAPMTVFFTIIVVSIFEFANTVPVIPNQAIVYGVIMKYSTISSKTLNVEPDQEI